CKPPRRSIHRPSPDARTDSRQDVPRLGPPTEWKPNQLRSGNSASPRAKAPIMSAHETLRCSYHGRSTHRSIWDQAAASARRTSASARYIESMPPAELERVQKLELKKCSG